MHNFVVGCSITNICYMWSAGPGLDVPGRVFNGLESEQEGKGYCNKNRPTVLLPHSLVRASFLSDFHIPFRNRIKVRVSWTYCIV